MPEDLKEKLPEGGEIQHAAVHCYLSNILAIADCMVQLCPEVGIAFKNRWRRLPQRIAFDLSAKALEVSRRTFEMDIHTFGELVGQYYSKGVPLMDTIASSGMQVADAVLERTARHIVLLETLAESIETAADLDGPQEIRGILEHQSSGIRNCARQAQEELLPLVSRFRSLVKECEQIVGVAKAAIVVDPGTGFLNANGFKQEHELRILEATPSCLLFIDCSARLPAGPACPDTVFSEIAEALGKRIAEPFRPNDSIGRLAPNRFAVVFDGEIEQARGRLDQIKRSISGKYSARSGKIILEAEVRLFESRDGQAFEEEPGNAVQSLASVV